MQIGQVSKATGASAKAIRHYESLGLLGPIERRGRYRRFAAEHVERVSMIRLAQRLGFRLGQLAWVATADWAEVKRRLGEQRALTLQALAELRHRLDGIDAALRELDGCPDVNLGGVRLGDCETPAAARKARRA